MADHLFWKIVPSLYNSFLHRVDFIYLVIPKFCIKLSIEIILYLSREINFITNPGNIKWCM